MDDLVDAEMTEKSEKHLLKESRTDDKSSQDLINSSENSETEKDADSESEGSEEE